MMRIQAIIFAMPTARTNEPLCQLSQTQANRAQTVQAKRVLHSDSATSISSQQGSAKPTATTKAHPNKMKLKNATKETKRSRYSNSDNAVKLGFATNSSAHTSTPSTCFDLVQICFKIIKNIAKKFVRGWLFLSDRVI